ncbi:PspC domain-containing protein [Actinoplanes sp. TBRC 11911]|uniref:PspC domain-containing protein n=1 Tax=Actinoplanes sp. TBRC 11911 TaxID=2729386 RepID=UPI00145CBE2F|nr:PspC domain-containing protein [Actinoplanes sp. TBRC 11911]NMO57024.1 PspC domain-containing protein [Actinoplanes sp. TBRC 11911]
MNDEAADKRDPSAAAESIPPAAPTSDPGPAQAPTAAEPPGAAGATEPFESPAGTEPFAATAPTADAAGDEPTAPIGPRPSAWTPPAGGIPEADAPPAGQGPPPPGAAPPPPPGAGPTPPPGAGPTPPPGPGPTPPPWSNIPGFNRAHLIRPKQGRYIAGVSGALARATNTDPVLWRVLLAVLGVMSGVGVLLYLIGWLVIPSEGDSASPVESLLGKGRSGMSPLSVVVLGGAAVLTFAFIVQDGVRAGLLAAAVILAAVLLIKRGQSNSNSPAPEAATFPGTFPAPPPPPPAPGAPSAAPTAEFPAAAFAAPAPAAATATEPVTEQLPPRPPQSSYRPPFAPHGPYAPQVPPMPPMPPVPQVPSVPRRQRRPRERSKLGRLTFFAVVVVLGLMAAIDMAGASIAVSAYFAAALVTIGLGLVVGAWLGRARGLIALGLITAVGLLVSTGAERWGGEIGNSVYRPLTIQAVADRYDFAVGNATLDLTQIDFAGQKQDITVNMKVGQLKVLLPPTVDTTATVQMQNGRAEVFGKHFDGRDVDGQQVVNTGPDGPGGGNLTLNLQMDTGNLEVNR